MYRGGFLSFYGKWKETVSVNRIQNFNQYQKLCSTFLQLKISSSPLQHHSADLCQNSSVDLFMMEKSNKNFYFSDNYTQPTPENSVPNLILSLWSWSERGCGVEDSNKWTGTPAIIYQVTTPFIFVLSWPSPDHPMINVDKKPDHVYLSSLANLVYIILHSEHCIILLKPMILL